MTGLADRLLIHAEEYYLAQRLRAARFPLGVSDALLSARELNPDVREWVRAGLQNGTVARTAQAELVAGNRTLAETARTTGVSVIEVLVWLSRGEDYFTPRDEDE